MICLNTCGTAGDAVCQDGGWGAFGSMCEFGTDCKDCGSRLLLVPPPQLPPSPESGPPPFTTSPFPPPAPTKEDITGLYVLAAGLAVTILVLVAGIYSKVKLQLSTSDLVSILIASGDAFTDIAFAVQQLTIMETLLDKVASALLVIFLVVPMAFSSLQIVRVLRSPHLDTDLLQERSSYYAFVLLVSLTNMEVLRALPWQKGTAMYDGLPDQKLMVKVWLIVMFLEDLPQLGIQTAVTIKAGGGLLGPLSLGFTLVALVWRALRSEASQKAHSIDAHGGRLVATAHLRYSPQHHSMLSDYFTCRQGDLLATRARPHFLFCHDKEGAYWGDPCQQRCRQRA